uniref:Uncharacterized protein n=1 Tax=Rhizophora mucronata TaxID=61149 RepID=A0A2P2IZ59_RHIMU
MGCTLGRLKNLVAMSQSRHVHNLICTRDFSTIFPTSVYNKPILWII